ELQLASPDNIDYLVLPRNYGKAEAVRRGITMGLKKAEMYVGYWDADLATPLEEILRFVEVLADKPSMKMVYGARWQRIVNQRLKLTPFSVQF
ncbi:MAG: glycosyltransferase, partial [Desulfobacterales bacterium]|nr:glycosyltransferase [Desulfobacterales bacterium]